MKTEQRTPTEPTPDAAPTQEGATAARPTAGGGLDRPPRVRASELRAATIHALKVFLVVRVLLAVVALVSVALIPDLSNVSPAVRQGIGLPIPGPVGVPGWPAHAITPGWHNVVTAWERFDGLWYLSIARHGYVNGNGSAAFYPLYPLAIRALTPVVGGHPLAAALLASNVAFLAALVVLYLLAGYELGTDVARRSVVFAAVFPTAFFFLAPYSESLFLLLALLTFWWTRRRRWWLAAAAAALAALTRNLGVVLVAPLAVESFVAWRRSHPRRVPWSALVATAAPAAGAFAYALYWRVVSGDWLASVHQQATWERHLTAPYTTVWRGASVALRYVGFYPGGYHELDLLVALPMLAATTYAIVRLRASYWVYAWAAVLVPLAYAFDGRPLMSFPRFALVVFPAYWAFALWTRDRPVAQQLAVACSATLLGVMTLLFAAWYYVF